MMGHGVLLGVGEIASLIGFAAALVLFIRRRSAATGLFLAGSAIPLLIRASAPLLGYGLTSMGVVVLSNVCAAAGLLWYAIKLPKEAPVAGPVAMEGQGNRFFK